MNVNQEKIIKFLLELEREDNSNRVIVSRNNIVNLQMTENEVMTILHDLQAIGLIRFIQKSPHNNLSMFATIELLSPCLGYFENKKEEKRLERNKWIQFWIPVSLSVVAIIISILALILEL